MRLRRKSRLGYILFCLSVAVIAMSQADATTHNVQFGGSFFHSYNPNTINVRVGDTVTWIGNGSSTFISHSLQSDTIPAGAESFGPINTGKSFSYVVQVSGYYHYICTEHQQLEDMDGSFIASPKLSVNSDLSAEFLTLDQNYPNPFSNLTTIHYSLKRAAKVSLSVYTIDGKETAVLLDAYKDAGHYEVKFNASALPEGVYFYELHSEAAYLKGKLTVERFIK